MKFSSLTYLFSATLVAFSLSPAGSGQSFQRTVYNSPRTPSDVFAADLNNDGRLDLLNTQFDGVAVTVFVNGGDGTFPDGGSGEFFGAGDDINRVVAVDLNGDGIADMVSQGCGSGGAEIEVLFGNGDGTFVQSRGYERATLPSACDDALGFITLAHATLPSLLLSTRDPQITIFQNDGTGVFSQQQSVSGAPGTILSGVSSGDYNGDGLQDIAAISTDSGSATKHVVIFNQNPDGTFAAPVTIFSSDAGLQLTHTVDLNGDTRGDLLVSFFGGPSKLAGVVAFTNLGGGNFTSTVLNADPLYTIAALKPASIHPVGNNAGFRGIILPLSPDPSIGGDPVFAVFPAQSTGWGKPIYFDDPGGAGPQAAANGDFNADGRPDFAAVDNNNHLLVFLNNTTADTCPYPAGAAVHICSPASGSMQKSTIAKIHASASSGPLPIVSMTATIDGVQVAASDMPTLDASVQTKPGRHTLIVTGKDSRQNVNRSSVTFIVQ